MGCRRGSLSWYSVDSSIKDGVVEIYTRMEMEPNYISFRGYYGEILGQNPA